MLPLQKLSELLQAECVGEVMEDTEKVASGQVSEVLQKGYTLNGRVIRPSMVKVAN